MVTDLVDGRVVVHGLVVEAVVLQAVVRVLQVRLGQGGGHGGAGAGQQAVDREGVGGRVGRVGRRPEGEETLGERVAGVEMVQVGVARGIGISYLPDTLDS